MQNIVMKHSGQPRRFKDSFTLGARFQFKVHWTKRDRWIMKRVDVNWKILLVVMVTPPCIENLSKKHRRIYNHLTQIVKEINQRL